MSTFSLYHFQVFSIMCHFRQFSIVIPFPQQGHSDPYWPCHRSPHLYQVMCLSLHFVTYAFVFTVLQYWQSDQNQPVHILFYLHVSMSPFHNVPLHAFPHIGFFLSSPFFPHQGITSSLSAFFPSPPSPFNHGLILRLRCFPHQGPETNIKKN